MTETNTPSNQSRNTGKAADGSSWVRMRFKKYKVWVEVGAHGRPLVKDGKVRIKYQLDQAYEYRVRLENLRPVESPPPEG